MQNSPVVDNEHEARFPLDSDRLNQLQQLLHSIKRKATARQCGAKNSTIESKDVPQHRSSGLEDCRQELPAWT